MAAFASMQACAPGPVVAALPMGSLGAVPPVQPQADPSPLILSTSPQAGVRRKERDAAQERRRQQPQRQPPQAQRPPPPEQHRQRQAPWRQEQPQPKGDE